MRDYGEEANTVWGGDPNCEHEWVIETTKHDNLRPSKVSEKTIVGSNKELRFRTGEKVRSAFCVRCNAWYGQLGLEPSLDMYIEHLLEIMRELKRVLKKTGVIFWVHGDCYGGSGAGTWKNPPEVINSKENYHLPYGSNPRRRSERCEVKPKCMALQNFRFIIRCIDELGLILRDTIIWVKSNHMPESVKDRFTRSYEPVFMLVKSKKYWFDLDAVRVPFKPDSLRPTKLNKNNPKGMNRQALDSWLERCSPLGKNPGDVWEIPTQPFPEAHFAVYPEKLVERMIKAACPQEICKKCGKPRERIVERGEFVRTGGKRVKDTPAISERQKREGTGYHQLFMVGWTDCGCSAGWESSVVLDPFLGSGTTALVALKLGRRFVGVVFFYSEEGVGGKGVRCPRAE